MSVKVMGWIWDTDLPQDEKLVALAYADHASHDGTNIFPAISSIAQKTGYSERSIQRITRKLAGRRLLLPDGEGPKGTRKWRMAIPLYVAGDNMTPPRFSEQRGDKLSPPHAADVTGGVTPVSPRGDIAMSPEPSLTVNEPEMPSSESFVEEGGQAQNGGGDDNHFAQVIKAWEKTVGPITAGISEDLGDLADELRPVIAGMPPGSQGADLSAEAWVTAAITEARQSSNGRRPNVHYVQKILDGWRARGFQSPYGGKLIEQKEPPRIGKFASDPD